MPNLTPLKTILEVEMSSLEIFCMSEKLYHDIKQVNIWPKLLENTSSQALDLACSFKYFDDTLGRRKDSMSISCRAHCYAKSTGVFLNNSVNH